MTTQHVKLVHTVIKRAGESQGFRKKGSTWYRDDPKALAIIHPQKSQYGPSYYLNVGIYFRQLGTSTYPGEWDWHLQGRASSVLGEQEGKKLEELLDFENDFEEELRLFLLVEKIRDDLIPGLIRLTDLEWVRNEYTAGRLERWLRERHLVEFFNSHEAGG